MGAAYAALLVVLPSAAVWRVDRALRTRPLSRSAFAGLVVWTTLGGRSLGRAARTLAAAVRRGDLDRARDSLLDLAGRDPAGLCAEELCRAATESVAENTADAVVAPLLWTALAGPAAGVAYRAVNTLDAMVGHRDERYEAFGWAAARADDLATWVPARLASLCAVLCAPVVGGRAGSAWQMLRRDGRAHPSPNAGRLEATFAGALGVRLGGVNRYGTRIEVRPKLGEGTLPSPEDVERAASLAAVVGLLATFLAVLWAWWQQP
jgi:adenosylcobinamide-phosphate synthase